MRKITIIGAGGYVFPIRLSVDILSLPELQDSILYLSARLVDETQQRMRYAKLDFLGRQLLQPRVGFLQALAHRSHDVGGKGLDRSCIPWAHERLRSKMKDNFRSQPLHGLDHARGVSNVVPFVGDEVRYSGDLEQVGLARRIDGDTRNLSTQPMQP